jgi:hypothetical protein
VALSGFAMAQAYPPAANPAAAGPQQEGTEHGYRDGFHRGVEDHAANAGNKYKTEDWEHGDRGYAKYMGDKDMYKDAYKAAYQRGYQDGYSNRRSGFGPVYVNPSDPYYRPGTPPVEAEDYYRTDTNENVYTTQGWPPQNVASEIGYRDGITWAQYDLRNGNAPNPETTWVFRRADHGYRDQYGDKRAYQQAYRQAFVQAYQDTFGNTSR